MPQKKLGGPQRQLEEPQRELKGPRSQLGGPWWELGGTQMEPRELWRGTGRKGLKRPGGFFNGPTPAIREFQFMGKIRLVP